MSVVVYWFYRPNMSYINPNLEMNDWDAVSDGTHNSNTDMILWKGEFLLIHASSPFHLGTAESKLVIRKSSDAKNWNKVVELDFESGDDIRDPKFAIINGKLFLYAMANSGTIAKPYKTMYCTSSDGITWSEWADLKGDAEQGWLFWRPKTPDGQIFYVPAYWWEHGKSRLFKSVDGITWETISDIHEGETNDETAIEFYPDGTLICTARLEGITDINLIGDSSGSTLISVAEAPYTEWKKTKSKLTRLDGPYLFEHDGEVYAAGRYEPDVRGLFAEMGSFMVRKRTSLFLVEETGLTYLSDLPSNGDTSYTGVVMKDGDVYISYYTNDINKDLTWLLGVISPSDIRIATMSLEHLKSVGGNPPTLPDPVYIKIDGIIVIAGLLCVGYVVFHAIYRERG